jgi:hypothetical protein
MSGVLLLGALVLGICWIVWSQGRAARRAAQLGRCMICGSNRLPIIYGCCRECAP